MYNICNVKLIDLIEFIDVDRGYQKSWTKSD